MGYSTETEYKHQYDATRASTLPPPPPPADTTREFTSTNIGLPKPVVPMAAPLPKWVNAKFTSMIPPGAHYAPASMAISGAVPPLSFRNKFCYKSAPAATQRYLRTPYLLPGDAGTGLDSRPASSVAAFDLGGAYAAALLNAAEVNYQKRASTASSWTAEHAANPPVLMPAESYRTTTKDSFPLRSGADTQQQRMRDWTSSKHVNSLSLSSSTLRCPTAPLADSTALHTQRFLAIRSSDGGRRVIDTAEAFDAPPAAPPVPVLLREPRLTAYVPSQPTTTSARFQSA